MSDMLGHLTNSFVHWLGQPMRGTPTAAKQAKAKAAGGPVGGPANTPNAATGPPSGPMGGWAQGDPYAMQFPRNNYGYNTINWSRDMPFMGPVADRTGPNSADSQPAPLNSSWATINNQDQPGAALQLFFNNYIKPMFEQANTQDQTIAKQYGDTLKQGGFFDPAYQKLFANTGNEQMGALANAGNEQEANLANQLSMAQYGDTINASTKAQQQYSLDLMKAIADANAQNQVQGFAEAVKNAGTGAAPSTGTQLPGGITLPKSILGG